MAIDHIIVTAHTVLTDGDIKEVDIKEGALKEGIRDPAMDMVIDLTTVTGLIVGDMEVEERMSFMVEERP